jgi:hypothetical protein
VEESGTRDNIKRSKVMSEIIERLDSAVMRCDIATPAWVVNTMRDARRRIAELEAVAEEAIKTLAPHGIPDHELSTTVRLLRKPIIKALRAAGYLGVGDE